MFPFSFHKWEIHDYRISGEYHKSNNSFYIQDVFDKPPVLLSCSPYLFRSIIQCWINMCQFCLIAKMNNASKRNWSKNTPRSIKRIVLWFFFLFFITNGTAYLFCKKAELQQLKAEIRRFPLRKVITYCILSLSSNRVKVTDDHVVSSCIICDLSHHSWRLLWGGINWWWICNGKTRMTP